MENLLGVGDGFLLAPSPFILTGGGCAVPQFKFWSHAGLTQVPSSSGIRKERNTEKMSGGCVSLWGLTKNSVLTVDLDETNILSQKEVYCYSRKTTFLTADFRETLKKWSWESPWIFLTSLHWDGAALLLGVINGLPCLAGSH